MALSKSTIKKLEKHENCYYLIIPWDENYRYMINKYLKRLINLKKSKTSRLEYACFIITQEELQDYYKNCKNNKDYIYKILLNITDPFEFIDYLLKYNISINDNSIFKQINNENT